MIANLPMTITNQIKTTEVQCPGEGRHHWTPGNWVGACHCFSCKLRRGSRSSSTHLPKGVNGVSGVGLLQKSGPAIHYHCILSDHRTISEIICLTSHRREIKLKFNQIAYLQNGSTNWLRRNPCDHHRYVEILPLSPA